MNDSANAVETGLPAHVQLIQMCAGAWVASGLYAAAKLGLADQLANGPRSALDLASWRAFRPSRRQKCRR